MIIISFYTHHPMTFSSFSIYTTRIQLYFFFFFLKDPAPPEFSPLPLPAPLPICQAARRDGDDLHAHLAVAGNHVQTEELLLDYRLGQTACIRSGGVFAGFGFAGSSSILP